jgi:hypothetical protein
MRKILSLFGIAVLVATSVFSVLPSQPVQADGTTYTISGNAGVGGVILNYTNGTAMTVTADSSGNYSITVPAGWSGTVTPSLAGYMFYPDHETYSNVQWNQHNGYTAYIPHTISGNVGMAGVTIFYETYGNLDSTTISDVNGNYSVVVPSNWSIGVTPSKTGYFFNPQSRSYNGVPSDLTGQNFTPIVAYEITGNAGVAYAEIDDTTRTDISPIMVAQADQYGNYFYWVPNGWSGTLTPNRYRYFFTPSSRTYSKVQEFQTDQDYSAAHSITISGNTGMVGVKLSYFDGIAKSVTSDSKGNYSFPVLSGWSGTIYPSKDYFVFNPSNYSYNNLTTNQTNQNFSEAQIAFCISGSIGVGDVKLVYQDGYQKTVFTDNKGNYSFWVPVGWSGGVSPSKIGYSFSPLNRNYLNVTSNQSFQNFNAITKSYVISGNAGIAGVVLNYTDGTPKSTTTDINGNYAIQVSANWSGMITPSKPNMNFIPANRNYANVQANQNKQNYSFTPARFISGNIGVAGVNLSYYDGTSKTVLTDNNGYYKLSISAGWSGTVTPSKANYSFSPVNRRYSKTQSDQTKQNYTAVAVLYTISGNTGVAGITLNYFDGESKTTISDNKGNYAFTIQPGWTGTVTPEFSDHVFVPENRTYNNVQSDQNGQNYTTSPFTYTISGNVGVAGVLLNYDNGSSMTSFSDGNGNFAITIPAGWSGTIIPSLAGYTFSPSNLSYTNVFVNETGQDFTATAHNFTISGNVGISGATVSYTGIGLPSGITFTDSNGNYSIVVPNSAQQISVNPSMTGYTFSPTKRTYSSITNNQGGQDFSPNIVMLTVSGRVVVAGATISYFDGSLKSVTSDSSGNFSLQVPYNWSGTLTPSLTGYRFDPSAYIITNIHNDQSNIFFSPTAIKYITGNTGLPGVTLSYTDTYTRNAVSDGNGNYTLSVSVGWSGSITPTLTGYTFSPNLINYNNVQSDQSNQNYTPIPITYTISGNTGIDGVTLGYSDGSNKTVVSDENGNYSLTVSYNWSGTVTPSSENYRFVPASRNYSGVLADQPNQDYDAKSFHTISGNAGVAGVTLSYTDGTVLTTTTDESGNYALKVPDGWSGTLTPSLAGYTFSPANYNYTNVTIDQTDQNFVSTPITYTISGTTSIAGVTISYIDGPPKSVISDNNAQYSFVVPYHWSGIVTATYPGQTFTPAKFTLLSVQMNYIYVSFYAHANIVFSGNAGIPGVTITCYDVYDGLTQKVTTDESGGYSCQVFTGWPGDISAKKDGYTFSPTGYDYSNKVIWTDLTDLNFTPTAITYAISGNAGVANAILNYNDGTQKSVIADSNGDYSITIPYNWSGDITPSLSGYTFSPEHLTYTQTQSDQTSQNYYAASNITYSGNVGVAGATITYNGGTPKTTISDNQGNYSFTVTSGWSGTVTPSLIGYKFMPDSRKYDKTYSDQADQNFSALPSTIAISGNAGVGGAILTYSLNGTQTITADKQGNYSFVVPYGWSGTLTPSIECLTATSTVKKAKNPLATCHFSPIQKIFSNVQSDQPNQNFIFDITQ